VVLRCLGCRGEVRLCGLGRRGQLVGLRREGKSLLKPRLLQWILLRDHDLLGGLVRRQVVAASNGYETPVVGGGQRLQAPLKSRSGLQNNLVTRVSPCYELLEGCFRGLLEVVLRLLDVRDLGLQLEGLVGGREKGGLVYEGLGDASCGVLG